MMYMDQSGVASIPGPSNYQDNSALVPHDSQPQGKEFSLQLSVNSFFSLLEVKNGFLKSAFVGSTIQNFH